MSSGDILGVTWLQRYENTRDPCWRQSQAQPAALWSGARVLDWRKYCISVKVGGNRDGSFFPIRVHKSLNPPCGPQGKNLCTEGQIVTDQDEPTSCTYRNMTLFDLQSNHGNLK